MGIQWMIFCQPNEVDAVWSVVARATANNDLGIAAKVAPDGGDDRRPRLMCIYTKDFTDMKDITRVVRKLKDLGAIESRKVIYYKCGKPHSVSWAFMSLICSDAFTHLGIDSTNPYNIKASLYNSTDVLQAKPEEGKDGKLDGFFHKKKKDDGDWRSLEYD